MRFITAYIPCKETMNMQDIMTFFEKHFEYINATATARAVEIATITGRYDIDDYKQEMFLYLVRQMDNYKSDRSSPHTYINMVITSAKRIVIRSMYRNKNRIISQAKALEYAAE